MDYLAITIPGPNGPVTVTAPGNLPEGGYGSAKFETIVQTGITLLVATAVILALLYLIWGGINWITSEGDKQKLAQARKKIIFSIIGLLVVFLSFFMINFLFRFFRLP